MTNHHRSTPTTTSTSTSTLRRIGELVDLPTELARIARARAAYRADRIARYRLPESVGCPTCGDTGYMLDHAMRPCLACEPGRAIADRLDAEKLWETRCPKRFRPYRLETHPQRGAVGTVVRWLDERAASGQNLILLGGVGTGKTGLGIAAIREASLRGHTVQFGTAADILDAMRPRRDDANKPDELAAEFALRRLQTVDILLLDDLGAEKQTDWAAERLYLVINGRYERELPTIVTSNLTVDQLTAMHPEMGARIVSRLLEHYELIPLLGADRRRP